MDSYMATDPEPSRSELVARAKQARSESRALRELAADAAEEVARVEDEVVRVHETIAGQGGPLAHHQRAPLRRAAAGSRGLAPGPAAASAVTVRHGGGGLDAALARPP